MRTTFEQLGLDPAKFDRRPWLHLDAGSFDDLCARLADAPDDAFQRCRHDLRPGPGRPPRQQTAVLEAIALVAAVSGATAEVALLQTQLELVLGWEDLPTLGRETGRTLAAGALACDLCQGVLKDEEHAELRRLLTVSATRSAAALGPLLARPWAHEDPELVSTLAGLQLAALALGPNHDQSAAWLALTDPALASVLATVALDGWWPTGFEDWNELLPLLVRVVDAWHHLTGIDRFEHGVFEHAADTALHALAPNTHDVLAFDRVGRPDHPLRRALADGRRDDHYRWRREPCRWALERLAKRFPTSAFRAAVAHWYDAALGRGSPWRVLYSLSEQQPKAWPERPYHVFEAHGLAVWRSSWEPDALQVALSAGPGYGRQPLPPDWRPAVELDGDANHFTLTWQGEALAFDTGRLEHAPSALHNTVLVNGQSQRSSLEPGGAAGLTAAWLSPAGGVLVGDAGATYPAEAGLQVFQRHLALTEGYVLVWDRLSASRACRYEWLLHTPGVVSPEGGSVETEIVLGRAALGVTVLRPDRVKVGIREAVSAGAVLGQTLSVSCQDEVFRTQFLVVIAPKQAGARAPFRATLVTGETSVGALLSWADGDAELVLFPTAERGIELEHLLSDAAWLAFRRRDNGDWRRLQARHVRKVLVPGGQVLTASQWVDVALEERDGQITGEVNTPTGATLTLRCPFEPRGLLVDGSGGRAKLDGRGRLATVRLTAGRHHLRLTSR